MSQVHFDTEGLLAALDHERGERGWYDVAADLWEQSAVLNLELGDHPLCGGALQRLAAPTSTSCQYVLFMLRWLDRVPEDFLVGPSLDVGPSTLPAAGSHQRLRFDLSRLYADLDAARRDADLTWRALGAVLGCSPARLTNLRSARRADIDLVLGATRWLGVPSSTYVDASRW